MPGALALLVARKDLAGVEHVVWIEYIFNTLLQRNHLRSFVPECKYGALVRPMPCSPVKVPPRRTTVSNSSNEACFTVVSCDRVIPQEIYMQVAVGRMSVRGHAKRVLFG
jgi:hypothetical protein